MNYQIVMEDIKFRYSNEGKWVLKDVSLKIKQGEFIAIIGHNGSGKSTLAKHLNGLLVPDSGKVMVAGIDTREHDRIWDIREQVGMVFQNPDNQIVATIVEEDVAFGPENQGVSPKEIRERVDTALKAVNMEDYKTHGPHLLSGGQKQRVAIAGVLAMKPRCIVLDEATAMLDPRGRKEVIETIRKLNAEEGITIIHITHYMEEAVQADRVMVMDDGRLVMTGSPKEVFSRVDQLKGMGLDVPQLTELSYRLKADGINIPGVILSEHELVRALCLLRSES